MNYLRKYLTLAPTALAIVRANECHELSSVALTPPILDLGCGDGVFAQVFFEKPVEIGFDISAREIAEARRLALYKHVVVGDAHALPFPSESFSTVFSNSVLEHIPNLRPVLAEVGRILRPGGRLVLTAPTPGFQDLLFFSSLFRQIGLGRLAECYGRAVNQFFRHHNLLDLATWEADLRAAGLRIESHRFINPAAVLRIHDLFLAPSVAAYFSKGLLGRWIMWPGLRALFAAPFLAWLLAGRVGASDSQGGSHLIVARKEG